MEINKKIIIMSAVVASAATLAAVFSVNSAFGRIERLIIEENEGESISGLAGELAAKQRIESSCAVLKETISGLDMYVAGIKEKAAAVTPASQQATEAFNELQASIAAMETSANNYKSEANELLVMAGVKKNTASDGNGGYNNISVPLSAKWKVFITNEIPVIDVGSFDNKDGRSSGVLLADNIDSFMSGSVTAEKDNAYLNCELSLKKVNEIVEADKAAAAEAEARKKQESSSSGSSSGSKSSSSSSSSGTKSSSSSSKSSGSSSKSNSSSSKSSSSSSRSSGSSSGSRSSGSGYSSGSSSRSSVSSGGSSSGGSSGGSSGSSSSAGSGGGGLGASSGR